MTDSNTSLKDASSLDLTMAEPAIVKSLTRPEEKELVSEVFKRLRQYAQLNTGPMPPAEGDGVTPHELHIQRLRNACHFYGTVSQVLGNRGLLDWSQPFEKIADGLGAAIDNICKRSTKLLALICELYVGGVKFNTLALPEEVEERVVATLKERGMIPRN